MKKIISLLLAVIIISGFLPISTYASESPSSARQELINSACDAFPEFASKIKTAPESATYGVSRTVQSCHLVVEETRKISDTEYIAYSEFSDGAVYLTSYALLSTYSVNSITSDNASTTVFSANISTTCNYNGDFFATIHNVRYAIVAGDYDYFISAGTPGNYYCCKEAPKPFIVRKQEGANIRAEAGCYYTIYNEDGTDYRTFVLNMYLFNGQFSTTPSF